MAKVLTAAAVLQLRAGKRGERSPTAAVPAFASSSSRAARNRGPCASAAPAARLRSSPSARSI